MARLGNHKSRPDQEIVLHQDERIPVLDSIKAPYCWVCSLEVEFPEPVIYPLGTLEYPGKNWRNLPATRKGCGSGLLISPAHVLTAAHVIAGLKVVKDPQTGKEVFKVVVASKVIVIPARTEENRQTPQPFGAFSSTQVRVSPGFKVGMEQIVSDLTKAQIRRTLPFDFGIVEVEPQRVGGTSHVRFPGLEAGWWGEHSNDRIQPVDLAFRQQLQEAKVHILGYPGEKSATPCGALWRSFDHVVDAFPTQHGKTLDLLLYQADTSAGMSGSPVWVKDKTGQRYLVGVHSSFLDYKDKRTGQMKRANVAAMITAEMVAQLRVWKIGWLEIFIKTKGRLAY